MLGCSNNIRPNIVVQSLLHPLRCQFTVVLSTIMFQISIMSFVELFSPTGSSFLIKWCIWCYFRYLYKCSSRKWKHMVDLSPVQIWATCDLNQWKFLPKLLLTHFKIMLRDKPIENKGLLQPYKICLWFSNSCNKKSP